MKFPAEIVFSANITFLWQKLLNFFVTLYSKILEWCELVSFMISVKYCSTAWRLWRMFKKLENRVLCFSLVVIIIGHSRDFAGNVSTLDMKQCSCSSKMWELSAKVQNVIFLTGYCHTFHSYNLVEKIKLTLTDLLK